MDKTSKRSAMKWDARITYCMSDFERAYSRYLRLRNDRNWQKLSDAFGDFLECVEEMNRDYNRQLTFQELLKERGVRRTCDDYTIRYFTEEGRREGIAEIRAKIAKI